MIREFTKDDWSAYAGAVRWRDPSSFRTAPLTCELGEWTFIVSAAGTEVHRVEGSTITVYGALNGEISDMPLMFPTQRFAYSWLFALTVIFTMYGKFDPAEYGMIEIATI